MKRNILYLTAFATLSLSVMACNDEVVHQGQLPMVTKCSLLRRSSIVSH